MVLVLRGLMIVDLLVDVAYLIYLLFLLKMSFLPGPETSNQELKARGTHPGRWR